MAILAGAAAVGYYGFASERDEEGLFLRLMGHALLGFFTFTLNGLPLPIGYPIALYMASKAERNQAARRAAATTTFVLWLIGLLLS